MKIEKLRSKLKKAFNRVMGVLLPVATLFVSCGTNALVVHAVESGQSVHIVWEYEVTGESTSLNKQVASYDTTYSCGAGYEIVACYASSSTTLKTLYITVIDKNTKSKIGVLNYGTGTYKEYHDGKLKYEYSIPKNKVPPEYIYCGNGTNTDYRVTKFSIGGNIKIFKDNNALNSYIKSGDTSGMIEVKDPENEKNWYLKNVSYKVTADDSPSSEAGADATYIHFSWDTDNLQDGDLLEIKTYNYYKKILGEKLSGFHDFVTYSDGVAASSGKYSFSQYTATKAWFNSLENKPLAFKEYDTTDYYLRPVRMGTLGVEKYGGWVHIKMGRSTPTSSPYIEDIEYGDFDDDNNWTVDEDLTDKNGGHHGVDQGGGYIPPDQSDNPFTGTNIAGIFSYFYDFMKQIPAMLGDLPALVGNIISFLPKPIIAFIGIGVIVAIILRIVGR